MDKEEFIQQYQDDRNQTNLMDIVYNELVDYCQENNIDEDDITTEELEEIARQIIQENTF